MTSRSAVKQINTTKSLQIKQIHALNTPKRVDKQLKNKHNETFTNESNLGIK